MAGQARHLALVVASVVALVLVVPVQLASMILFDATGLDAATPSVVFMAVGPGLATGLVPTAIAARRYDRRKTLAVAAVAVVGCTSLAGYLTRFYGLCGGPGC